MPLYGNQRMLQGLDAISPVHTRLRAAALAAQALSAVPPGPCCALNADRLPAYGGQAVLEGVMMRGQRYMAVAVRAPSQEIVLKTEALPARLYQGRVSRIPILRGSLLLWDALGLGLQALMFSANVALGEPEAKGVRAWTWAMAILGVALGIGLFFLLPASLTVPVHHRVENALVTNGVEGLIRLGLLVGYIAAIGFLPDVRRVFGYHGAEHKAINAFEAGAPLAVPEVSRYSIRHPRCGTNFLLIVAVLSVALFALLGRPESWLLLLGSRVVLVPLIAGIAYETIRWGAAHMDRLAVRGLMVPGLALQALSTRHPDAEQVEVGACALRELLRLERPDLLGTPSPLSRA